MCEFLTEDYFSDADPQPVKLAFALTKQSQR